MISDEVIDLIYELRGFQKTLGVAGMVADRIKALDEDKQKEFIACMFFCGPGPMWDQIIEMKEGKSDGKEKRHR